MTEREQEALVPRSIPLWRPATLGILALIGVGATMLPAALAVMLLENWLVAERDASQLPHAVALGSFVVLWGVLSLGILAAAARLTMGRGAAIARRDAVLAGVVLLLLGAWVVALHAWNVGVAGKVELDLIGRGTYAWPVVVVFVVVALATSRLTGRRVGLVLLGLAIFGISALVFEATSNVRGALADNHVSTAGLAVGMLSAAQLIVLAAWWIDAGRPASGGSLIEAARRLGRIGLIAGLSALGLGLASAGAAALLAGGWYAARQPMIGLGLDLIVAGLAATGVFAAILNLVERIGWLRLLAIPPALVLATMWTVYLTIGVPTTGRGGPATDIRTLIYTLPALLALFVVLTLLIALPLLIAWMRRRHDRPS